MQYNKVVVKNTFIAASLQAISMVYSALSTNVYKGLQQYNYNNSCTHPSPITLPSTVEAKDTHSTSQTEVKGERADYTPEVKGDAEMSWTELCLECIHRTPGRPNKP